MQEDRTPTLGAALRRIDELLASMASMPSALRAYQAPVLDTRTGPWVSPAARGLAKYTDSVHAQRAQLLELMQRGEDPGEDPMPSVQSTVTVWKTVLAAEPPVTGIRTDMRAPSCAGKRRGKAPEGFVDVVARGGTEWIRVYRQVALFCPRKKPGSLLAEFREQDSYINSDSEDGDDGDDRDEAAGAGNEPSSAPRNSLVELAEGLLSLAKIVQRPPGADDPTITLRITRIPADCHADPRFQQSFDYLRSRGVNLLFGGMDEVPLVPLVPPCSIQGPMPRYVPSRRLCLDPTALMALCSDLLHHPLPVDLAGAKARFFRPSHALKNVPGGQSPNGPGRDGGQDDDWIGQSQNSRELVKNLVEEMEQATIEELRDTLESCIKKGDEVEWWTTREAIGYLKETLGGQEIVGNGMEQMRMRRLLGLEDGDFFKGSRYMGNEGVLRGIRVRVFEESKASGPLVSPTPFHRALADVAQSCLDDYDAWSTCQTKDSAAALANFLKPQRLPVPKVAHISLPFPIVSLSVLARGAREGMTTVMMGNVLLRDLFGQPRWKVNGWAHACYGQVPENNEVQAAVWMLPFRSLGEGKRVKFEAGDFSYPHR